jgi:hypothetical protein
MDDYSWLKNTLSDTLGYAAQLEMAKINKPEPQYVQGQPAMTSAISGINPVWLLVGAGVLLVVMLKD